MLCCALSASCSVTRNSGAVKSISALKFLDEYVIPLNSSFAGTTIGGLSGIDYDKKTDSYFIISDDRSFTGPARFYRARLIIRDDKIDSLAFLSVHALKRPGGALYPSFKQDPHHTPDPEGIRFDSRKLTWCSEGDKAVREKQMVYQDPYIFEMDTTGNFLDSFLIPANLKMQAAEKGPRENGALEGITISPDRRWLFASMEEPIHEDGPLAQLDYAGAPVRITKFDRKTRKPVAQYAYLLESLARAPNPASGFFINGVDEILALDNHRMLVMERSFSVGSQQNTIRIFLADLLQATDVINTTGLHKKPPFKPVVKSLLLNLDSLGFMIDNLEGICFGPQLSNGHQSLVLIADNNFSQNQVGQVMLFEIIP